MPTRVCRSRASQCGYRRGKMVTSCMSFSFSPRDIQHLSDMTLRSLGVGQGCGGHGLVRWTLRPVQRWTRLSFSHIKFSNLVLLMAAEKSHQLLRHMHHIRLLHKVTGNPCILRYIVCHRQAASPRSFHRTYCCLLCFVVFVNQA